MLYPTGTIFICKIKSRGLNVGQSCRYISGNDLIYQVVPLLKDGKPGGLKIDVPNYSVKVVIDKTKESFDEEPVS